MYEIIKKTWKVIFNVIWFLLYFQIFDKIKYIFTLLFSTESYWTVKISSELKYSNWLKQCLGRVSNPRPFTLIAKYYLVLMTIFFLNCLKNSMFLIILIISETVVYVDFSDLIFHYLKIYFYSKLSILVRKISVDCLK